MSPFELDAFALMSLLNRAVSASMMASLPLVFDLNSK